MTTLDNRLVEVAPHAPTPFATPEFFNSAKSNVRLFEQTFAAPAYPTPYRSAFGTVDVRNGWDLVEAAYSWSQLLTVPRYIDDFLAYVDHAIPLASTSVSADVFQVGAPSAWLHYLVAFPGGPRTHLTAQRVAARTYVGSFVKAVYIHDDEYSPLTTAEGDFSDGEDTIRAETVRALGDVGSFMGWTDEALARAGSFRRSSIYNWERGTRPQAAKVATLFSIDALITSLRRRLGDRDARLWLDGGEPARSARLLIGDFQSVANEAELLLFPIPPAATDVGFWVEAAANGTSDFRPSR